jgi:hypothetical protein
VFVHYFKTLTDNETLRTGSLTGTMVQVVDGKRQEGSFCRFSDDKYNSCGINGAINRYAGPVTVQFQTDGSNYNATTRFNQEFFGFRAYYFTGTDATNLQGMNRLITGRMDDILTNSISETLDNVAGLTHEFTFMCPVRNYTVLTCATHPPCNPACDQSLYACCGGFCVPTDEYGDPFPTVHEIVMVKPELLYRLNPAVAPGWTASSIHVVELKSKSGQFTQRLHFNNSFASASLEVDTKQNLLMFNLTDLNDPLWQKRMAGMLHNVHKVTNLNPNVPSAAAAFQIYAALIQSMRSTNATFRSCKFSVTSVRSGHMTASMRFEYKDNRNLPYNPAIPAIYEDWWLLQPLQVQPNQCVANGSSLTMSAAGSFSTFTLYTRDQYSNPKILGGDVVNSFLISMDNYAFPQQLAADVVNNGNGTYFVEYLLTKTGSYFLVINVIPSGQIAPTKVNDLLSSRFNVKDSPLSVVVMSGPINFDTITILGNMQSGVASYNLMHFVRIYDIYGNLASPDVAKRLSVSVLHSSNMVPYQFPRTQSRFAAADIASIDAPGLPGDFVLTWMPVMTGWHLMSILLNRSNINVHINNSPFSLYILPAPIDPSSSDAYGQLFARPVLTVSERLSGTLKLRDALGNVRKETDIISTSRFMTSFRGIELSDCPFIQNNTLLDILKACPSLFNGNMSISRRCTSFSYLTTNIKPALVDAFTLNGSISHTLDRHDKLLAWLANTIRANTCNQIARIAIDTALQLPRTVSRQRWEIVPPRDEIASLNNTSRPFSTTADFNENGERIFILAAACTAAGLYRVSVSISNELVQGLPHLLLVQPASPEASTATVFGSLLNIDFSGRAIHSGFVKATEPYEISVFLRDRFGNFVWSGKPDMHVELGDLYGYRCESIQSCFPAKRADDLKVSATYSNYKLIDTNDGAYTVHVTMPLTGQFDVNIFLIVGASKTLIGLSPYYVNVQSGNVYLENTYVDGQGVISCGAGVICSFSVINRDKFNNLIVLPSVAAPVSHTCTQQNCNISSTVFSASIELYKLEGTAPVLLMLSSANFKAMSEAGKASISYAIQQAGQYSWKISINDRPAPGSPFLFSIFGGITSPNTTIVSGYGLVCAHPGFPSTFVIRTRDSFSNFKTAGGDIVEVRPVAVRALLRLTFLFLDKSSGCSACRDQRFRHWAWTVRLP